MKFKSNLHSLTLVLLASASTVALAQGPHLGGSGAIGGASQRPATLAISAIPASVTKPPVSAAITVTPAVPATGAQTDITGNTAAHVSGNAQAGAGMLNGTAQDTTNATHGVAESAVSGTGATTAVGKTTLAADDSTKVGDKSAAAHASHKKLHKTQHHASPLPDESDAALSASTDASVNSRAPTKTSQQ